MCYVVAKGGDFPGLSQDVIDKCIGFRGPDLKGIATVNNLTILQGLLSTTPPFTPQPIESSRYIFAFNGQFYGYIDNGNFIRRPYGVSDGLMFLSLVEDVGLTSAINCVIGAFSCVLFDKESGFTYLFRDRHGEKPLFLYRDEKRFLASSSMKIFSPKYSDLELDLNLDSLKTYFKFGHPGSNKFLFNQVISVPTMAVLVIKKTDDRYSYHVEDLKFSKIDEFSEEKFFEVVNAVLPQIPYSISLSDGIDSTYVLSHVGKNDENVNCIHFRQSQRSQDNVEINCRKMGVKAIFFDERDESFSEYFLTQLNDLFSYPYGDFSAALALKTGSLCASTGRRVLVTGDGGDELLSEYRRNNYAQLLYTIWKAPFLRKVFIFLIENIFVDRIIGQLPLFKHRCRKIQLALQAENEKKFLAHISGLSFVDFDTYGAFDELVNGLEGKSITDKTSSLDELFYLPNDICPKYDGACMLNSVENRSPLLQALKAFKQTHLEGLRNLGKGKAFFQRRIKDLGLVTTGIKEGFGFSVESFLSDSKVFIELEGFSELSEIMSIFGENKLPKTVDDWSVLAKQDPYLVWFCLVYDKWKKDFFE